MTCEACGDPYVTLNNPHYQSAVGHDTPEGGALGESFYRCTGETARQVALRTRRPTESPHFVDCPIRGAE